MLSTKSVLEYQKNNKDFTFSCPPEAPLCDVQEALHAFLEYTKRIIDSAQQMANAVAPILEPEAVVPEIVPANEIITEQTL